MRRKRKRPGRIRYSTLTAREQDEYGRSIDLLYDLRHGEDPYTKLLGKYGLTRRKVEKFLGDNLIRGGRGKRVRASENDRLVRKLMFPRPYG